MDPQEAALLELAAEEDAQERALRELEEESRPEPEARSSFFQDLQPTIDLAAAQTLNQHFQAQLLQQQMLQQQLMAQQAQAMELLKRKLEEDEETAASSRKEQKIAEEELCVLYQMGICQRGDNCPQSHGSGEVVPASNSFHSFETALPPGSIINSFGLGGNGGDVEAASAAASAAMFGPQGDQNEDNLFAQLHGGVDPLKGKGKGKPIENITLAQVTQAPWYKTTGCKFFALGKCSRGEACSYAHSQGEQRNLMRGAFSARRQFQQDMSVNVTREVKAGRIKEVQQAAARRQNGSSALFQDW